VQVNTQPVIGVCGRGPSESDQQRQGSGSRLEESVSGEAEWRNTAFVRPIIAGASARVSPDDDRPTKASEEINALLAVIKEANQRPTDNPHGAHDCPSEESD